MFGVYPSPRIAMKVKIHFWDLEFDPKNIASLFFILGPVIRMKGKGRETL